MKSTIARQEICAGPVHLSWVHLHIPSVLHPLILVFYVSPLISSLIFSLFLCCAPNVISHTSPLSHLYRAYLHRLLLRLVAPLSVTAQVDHAIFPHLYIRYEFNVFPTVQRAPFGCSPFPVHGEVPGKKKKREGEERRGEERRGEERTTNRFTHKNTWRLAITLKHSLDIATPHTYPPPTPTLDHMVASSSSRIPLLPPLLLLVRRTPTTRSCCPRPKQTPCTPPASTPAATSSATPCLCPA